MQRDTTVTSVAFCSNSPFKHIPAQCLWKQNLPESLGSAVSTLRHIVITVSHRKQFAVPVVQGGMHWVGYAELASAVSNAGGLGIVCLRNTPSNRGDVADELEDH
jgi:hypothetical protein